MKARLNVILMMFTLVFWTGVTFLSCDKKSDDNDNNGNYSSQDSDSDPVLDLVKQNVSTTVSYSDYTWHISIKSRLASAFPGRNIIYGIEYGYDRYVFYEHFKFNNVYQKDDGYGNMTIEYPVFAVSEEYGNENMYWDSYKSLLEKQSKGQTLTYDEKALFQDLVYYMNKAEYAAKNTFCGRLYAQIDGKRYYFCIIGKVPSDNHGNSGGSDDSGSGGSTSYEKPDIGFYDYTPYTTKLKVIYEIYNKSKTQVTSAKIYYGTSSNPSSSVSATVSSGQISATISGLKKGTTYYVKCTATGKGGTTTTGTTKLMTEY